MSSKYLDLTKKKLELTRLPHELLVPSGREWEFGTSKSEIEPLIDFWYVVLFLLCPHRDKKADKVTGKNIIRGAIERMH